MGFVLQKEIKLDSFGWKDCSIVLSSVTFKEIKDWGKKYQNSESQDSQNIDEVFKLIQAKFISGEALDENQEKVKITKDTLEEVPFNILLHCMNELIGTQPDPNSSAS